MTIQDLLIAWGRSRSVNFPPNDFPPQSPFARLIARGGIGLPPLPDEEVERIDRAVSSLKIKSQTKHDIIKLSYIFKLTDREIAREMNGSRSWVRTLRENAEHYLDGRLE